MHVQFDSTNSRSNRHVTSPSAISIDASLTDATVAAATVRRMRAAVMQNWQLRVDDVDDPVPQAGQVLTRVLACGICGSDLHMLRFGEELRVLMADVDQADPDGPVDPLRPQTFEPSGACVMGHEFCTEVVELGPGVDALRVGDRVVSLPAAFDASGVHAVGYSNHYPGGYGELMVLNQDLAIKVDAGVSSRLAALTEPMAVGVHAVNRSGVTVGDAAVVLGLGPVGLACVAELKRRGIGPVIGADFSPKRRSLAEHFGCDEVVDPAQGSAIAAWRRIDGSKPLVIFEAVGMPGMIDQAMRMAPRDSRILVVGVCMPQDHLLPMVGIGRELSIQFVLGYTPDEFADTHRFITEGAWDLEPLITGSVGVDDVPAAFEWLGRPDEHAKILVEPQ
jgi:threonine dehydrogenase-like Zn-dependent dehydrogenase